MLQDTQNIDIRMIGQTPMCTAEVSLGKAKMSVLPDRDK